MDGLREDAPIGVRGRPGTNDGLRRIEAHQGVEACWTFAGKA